MHILSIYEKMVYNSLNLIANENKDTKIKSLESQEIDIFNAITADQAKNMKQETQKIINGCIDKILPKIIKGFQEKTLEKIQFDEWLADLFINQVPNYLNSINMASLNENQTTKEQNTLLLFDVKNNILCQVYNIMYEASTHISEIIKKVIADSSIVFAALHVIWSGLSLLQQGGILLTVGGAGLQAMVAGKIPNPENIDQAELLKKILPRISDILKDLDNIIESISENFEAKKKNLLPPEILKTQNIIAFLKDINKVHKAFKLEDIVEETNNNVRNLGLTTKIFNFFKNSPNVEKDKTQATDKDIKPSKSVLIRETIQTFKNNNSNEDKEIKIDNHFKTNILIQLICLYYDNSKNEETKQVIISIYLKLCSNDLDIWTDNAQLLINIYKVENNKKDLIQYINELNEKICDNLGYKIEENSFNINKNHYIKYKIKDERLIKYLDTLNINDQSKLIFLLINDKFQLFTNIEKEIALNQLLNALHFISDNKTHKYTYLEYIIINKICHIFDIKQSIHQINSYILFGSLILKNVVFYLLKDSKDSNDQIIVNDIISGKQFHEILLVILAMLNNSTSENKDNINLSIKTRSVYLVEKVLIILPKILQPFIKNILNNSLQKTLTGVLDSTENFNPNLTNKDWSGKAKEKHTDMYQDLFYQTCTEEDIKNNLERNINNIKIIQSLLESENNDINKTNNNSLIYDIFINSMYKASHSALKESLFHAFLNTVILSKNIDEFIDLIFETIIRKAINTITIEGVRKSFSLEKFITAKELLVNLKIFNLLIKGESDRAKLKDMFISIKNEIQEDMSKAEDKPVVKEHQFKYYCDKLSNFIMEFIESSKNTPTEFTIKQQFNTNKLLESVANTILTYISGLQAGIEKGAKIVNGVKSKNIGTVFKTLVKKSPYSTKKCTVNTTQIINKNELMNILQNNLQDNNINIFFSHINVTSTCYDALSSIVQLGSIINSYINDFSSIYCLENNKYIDYNNFIMSKKQDIKNLENILQYTIEYIVNSFTLFKERIKDIKAIDKIKIYKSLLYLIQRYNEHINEKFTEVDHFSIYQHIKDLYKNINKEIDNDTKLYTNDSQDQISIDKIIEEFIENLSNQDIQKNIIKDFNRFTEFTDNTNHSLVSISTNTDPHILPNIHRMIDDPVNNTIKSFNAPTVTAVDKTVNKAASGLYDYIIEPFFGNGKRKTATILIIVICIVGLLFYKYHTDKEEKKTEQQILNEYKIINESVNPLSIDKEERLSDDKERLSDDDNVETIIFI